MKVQCQWKIGLANTKQPQVYKPQGNRWLLSHQSSSSKSTSLYSSSWSPLISSAASSSFVSKVIFASAGVEDDPLQHDHHQTWQALAFAHWDPSWLMPTQHCCSNFKPISSRNTSHIFVFPFNHSSLCLHIRRLVCTYTTKSPDTTTKRRVYTWVKGTFLLGSWQRSWTINATNIEVHKGIGSLD